MKKTFIPIILSFVLVTCKSSQIDTSLVLSPEAISGNITQSVNYLASDELLGRGTGTEGIDEAATFIENEFKKAGIKPYFDSYRDIFDARGKEAYNVIGYLEGNDEQLKNEFVIIGAHYDHIGYGKSVESDSIANGANDNASGTAVVLALSKYLTARKNNKRSILFVLFGAEEMGLLGSGHLAKRLKDRDLNLYTVMNFEMLGVPFIDRNYKVFLTGYDKSNMASVINGYAKSNLVGFSEVSQKYSLFMRSDNFPFYQEFHIPSHTISSCDLTNFDYYHHVDDEVDKMNFKFMAELVKEMIPVMEAICNTPTPEIKLNEE